MDGSDINNNYDLKMKYTYKLTTQLHNPKQSISSKISLIDTSYDPSKLKFHRKFETPDDCVKKYVKQELLQAVNEKVLYHGIQTLFPMPNSEVTMKNLALNSLLFKLDAVIK